MSLLVATRVACADEATASPPVGVYIA